MSYCCEECFLNEAIKKYIQENSSIVGKCKYCGSHNVSLISPITLGEYMCSCLEKAYEYIDEGTGAMYDNEDEMYLGPDGKEATQIYYNWELFKNTIKHYNRFSK